MKFENQRRLVSMVLFVALVSCGGNDDKVASDADHATPQKFCTYYKFCEKPGVADEALYDQCIKENAIPKEPGKWKSSVPDVKEVKMVGTQLTWKFLGAKMYVAAEAKRVCESMPGYRLPALDEFMTLAVDCNKVSANHTQCKRGVMSGMAIQLMSDGADIKPCHYQGAILDNGAQHTLSFGSGQINAMDRADGPMPVACVKGASPVSEESSKETPDMAFDDLIASCKAHDVEKFWERCSPNMHKLTTQQAQGHSKKGREHLEKRYNYSGDTERFDGRALLEAMLPDDRNPGNPCALVERWMKIPPLVKPNAHTWRVVRGDGKMVSYLFIKQDNRWLLEAVSSPEPAPKSITVETRL